MNYLNRQFTNILNNFFNIVGNAVFKMKDFFVSFIYKNHTNNDKFAEEQRLKEEKSKQKELERQSLQEEEINQRKIEGQKIIEEEENREKIRKEMIRKDNEEMRRQFEESLRQQEEREKEESRQREIKRQIEREIEEQRHREAEELRRKQEEEKRLKEVEEQRLRDIEEAKRKEAEELREKQENERKESIKALEPDKKNKLLAREMHDYNFENILELVELGADPNIQDRYGRTVLGFLVEKNKQNLVIELINLGVDINIQDKDGNTPLIIATQNKDYDMVHIILKSGADPNIKGNNGDTALHLACENNQLRIVKLLLSHKNININIQNNWRVTPLTHTGRYDKFEFFKLLTENWADFDILGSGDKDGNFYLHENFKDNEKIELLKVKKQADIPVKKEAEIINEIFKFLTLFLNDKNNKNEFLCNEIIFMIAKYLDPNNLIAPKTFETLNNIALYENFSTWRNPKAKEGFMIRRLLTDCEQIQHRRIRLNQMRDDTESCIFK